MSRFWLLTSCSLLTLVASAAKAEVAYQQADPASEVPAVAAEAATVPPPAQAQRPDINPYDRDIGMTVPLNFNRRVLGELDVLLTRDDRFIVYSEGFKRLIDPLLTEEAQKELAAVLAGLDSFEANQIENSGIRLDYDPGQLAVLVLRIDPSKRSVESLFENGSPEEPGSAPERFSAYLNTNITVAKFHSSSRINDPNVSLNGALVGR